MSGKIARRKLGYEGRKRGASVRRKLRVGEWNARRAGSRRADSEPADSKPADLKPADLKPADLKPADLRPAEDGALRGEELVEAAFCEIEQGIELGAGVTALFRGGLGLDEAAIGGHDDVHIDFRLGVLFVTEVEECGALDDANGGGGDKLGERSGFKRAGFDESIEGKGEGDGGSGDGCGAGAAVGLEDVAVEDDGAFAESFHVNDGAQAAADEALDLVGAAADLAALAFPRSAGDCGAGQHGVLGGDPATTGVAQPGRDAGLDGGVAENAGVAERDEDGALGGAHVIRSEGEGTKLGRGPAIAAVKGVFRKGNGRGVECIGHRGIVREEASREAVRAGRAVVSRFGKPFHSGTGGGCSGSPSFQLVCILRATCGGSISGMESKCRFFGWNRCMRTGHSLSET